MNVAVLAGRSARPLFRMVVRPLGVCLALPLFAPLALAGCGGSSSTAITLPPTSLEVSRTVPTIYQESPYNFLPFDKTYDDVATVQAFYRQTLALSPPLPPSPTGTVGPNNGCGPVLIPYHLTFRHETTTILAGTVTVGNCGTLDISTERGLPASDVREPDVAYFASLATVLGLTT